MLAVMTARGLEALSSSALDRLRFRKEKAGLRARRIGDGICGGDEGTEESSESEGGVSDEKAVRYAAGGLEGVVVEEATSSAAACC